MNYLVSILGLALLILVHEAGHFFTALAVNMRPRKFYIGFPPAIAKFSRNGIEYGIGAIPLGGYVKIPGMHRPAAADLGVGLDRARSEAPELTAPIARVERDLEAGDHDAARRELAELEAALAAAELSPQARSAAERAVRDVGDALSPDAYWRAGAWRRIAVIAAGPGTNLVFAIVLFAILFMLGTAEATRTIASVDPKKPAARAGITPGDEIVAIDGRPVAADDIARRIVASKGRPLRVTVRRGGKEVTLPPIRAVKAEGRYLIGIRLEGREGPGESPPTAFVSSLRVTWEVTGEIGKTLLRLSRGQGRNEISSPVGIVQGSSEALRQGFETYLSVLALISLSLALLNLLPLLPLDGGHIAFSIVEGIRGRAVPRHVYEKVSAVGIAIVLLLFFTGLSNDVNR
jgi:regulator of sigma E protease